MWQRRGDAGSPASARLCHRRAGIEILRSDGGHRARRFRSIPRTADRDDDGPTSARQSASRKPTEYRDRSTGLHR